MDTIKLNVNQLDEWAPKLHAGQRVLLSGTVYTSRDAAHKRYFSLLDEGNLSLLTLRERRFTMLALQGRRRIWRLVRVGLLRQAGWIRMPRVCWTWG